METIEVLETSTEVIEVIEQGPQGLPGSGHNPIEVVLVGNSPDVVIPRHDGTDATEVTLLFGIFSNADVIVNAEGLEVLTALENFTSVMEVHARATAPVGHYVQLVIWAENSSDGGVTWAPVPGSKHVNNVVDISSGSHSSGVSQLNVLAGTKIRIRATKLSSSSNTTLTLTGNPPLTVSTGTATGQSTGATLLYRKAL